jgi:prepilin-type processing-associated H-X9-DG protein/prepilin-type N-terminal cleavage/methylation domain-containing protein
MTNRRLTAFTLIELLVVISIIGILAGMLVPVLSSAKRKARATQCVNHLRQMSMATFLYAEENAGHLPYAWYDSDDNSVNNFYSLLMPVLYNTAFDGYYDFERKVFACPTRLTEPLVGPSPFKVSYGMNQFNSVKFPNSKTRRLAEAQANTPATTLLMADAAYTHNHEPLRDFDPYFVGYRHSTRANIAFYDGHVAPHSMKQTNQLTVQF